MLPCDLADPLGEQMLLADDKELVAEKLPKRGRKISMSSPDISELEIGAVTEVLKGPCLSRGPNLERFETGFAQFVGTPYAIGVSGGTAGLHLCVKASGVKERDLVITTPFSFVASANVILYERAVPVFVDVDPFTGNMDIEQVCQAAEDLIAGPPNAARRWLPPALWNSPLGELKAIIPVHLFGQPVDLQPLLELRSTYSIAVIEDACQAVGAEYKGCKVGSLGDSAVFAFYPNKQMTTGEGGMVVTSCGDWARLFHSLRNQGRDCGSSKEQSNRLGYNYRLDEMSAALGLAQLRRIEELLGKRERVAQWYSKRLREHELVEPLLVNATTTGMSWFAYVVRLKPPLSRETVIAFLFENGIPTRTYFPPIHLQPTYQTFGYRQGDFPVTEQLSDVLLALPFSSVLTETEVDYVCECLCQAVNRSN